MDFLTTICDTVISIVGEESFFNAIAMIAGAGYLWFKRQTRLDEVTDQRMKKALTCLEAGVSKTYRVYVAERKKANADGKLTEEERVQARNMAFSFARNYAFNEGLDLVKELGGDMLPVLIEKTIGGLKKDCAGPTPTPPTPTENTTTTPTVNPQ